MEPLPGWDARDKKQLTRSTPTRKRDTPEEQKEGVTM